jgi:hypothetical protein
MRWRAATVAFGLAAALALVSSGPRAAAEEQKWGTIKGRVVYDGDPPAREKIDVNKDQDHCLSKGPLFSETWVVNPKNKGVRWAFVYLAPVPDENNPAKKQALPINPALKEVPATPGMMDQPCCQFVPHCQALRQGQTWEVKNSAPIAHNVHWTGGRDNPGDNKIIPPGGEIKVTDLKAARLPVSVKCDIHGWMQAWVFVFNHPYYAVTDENGDFEIKGAPAGTYNLVVWHEAVGWRDIKEVPNPNNPQRPFRFPGTPVTIKPDTTTDLGNFALKKKD